MGIDNLTDFLTDIQREQREQRENYYIYAVCYSDTSIDSVLIVQGFSNIPSYDSFQKSKILGFFANKQDRDFVISLLNSDEKVCTVFRKNGQWVPGDEIVRYGEEFITTAGNETDRDNLGNIETF